MKKVTIKITNQTGHSTLSLVPKEALKVISTEAGQNGMWVYMDGNFQTVGNLTESDIARANEIVITNALLGG